MLAKNLAAAAGNAGEALYSDSVFSTYLYTGNGSTQTITNGIDLAGEGGLVWSKSRNLVQDHSLIDTVRGNGSILYSNLTQAADTGVTTGITAFSASGYSLGVGSFINQNTRPYASWTFRKAEKFFDVVTYTGNGVAGRTVAHNLGSVPGMVIVKSTSAAYNWMALHRSMSANDYIRLNSTSGAQAAADVWNSTAPTSTVFTVGTNINTNESGQTYVAYLFAHDAGGFGADGSENVISCGSFTTDGSGNATVNLGYEAQWVLMKKSSEAESWMLFDSMRGLVATPASGSYSRKLVPNLVNAEADGDECRASSTGFNVGGVVGGSTYIYIAIRRPMKPPSSGTEVYNGITWTGNNAARTITGIGFPLDLGFTHIRNNAGTSAQSLFFDRLRGASATSARRLSATNTNAETSYTAVGSYDLMDGFRILDGDSLINDAGIPSTYIGYFFKRASGFFDVVCYSGDSTLGRAVPHNLSAVPELMIVKGRNNSENWVVYNAASGATKYNIFNSPSLTGTRAIWANTTPTASNFYVGGSGVLGETNYSTYTYVAYLFASYPGVSKVGSYTGTGTTQQINCGFTGGARFVLIKRTDSTGDWYVWDSARGIVAGNDPYLLLNSTAAEVTNTDYVDTYSAGFEISSTAPAAINANGGTFIFLAIA